MLIDEVYSLSPSTFVGISSKSLISSGQLCKTFSWNCSMVSSRCNVNSKFSDDEYGTVNLEGNISGMKTLGLDISGPPPDTSYLSVFSINIQLRVSLTSVGECVDRSGWIWLFKTPPGKRTNNMVVAGFFFVPPTNGRA